MARRKRNKKWTAAEAESALDYEAIRSEADLTFNEGGPEIGPDGAAHVEVAFRDTSEWFQDDVTQRFMDATVTDEIEALYDDPPSDPATDAAPATALMPDASCAVRLTLAAVIPSLAAIAPSPSI